MAVSVVLNGSRSGTRVSQATRQRILDIAHELNYRPNSVARSLARRATRIFGFYSGFNYFDARNPFMAELAAGLLEACAASKRDLLLHSVFRGQLISGLYEDLLSGKVDGLVVWAPDDDPLVALLRDSSLPVVSVVELLPGFPSVTVDEHGGAVQIARYLFDKGHRSILYRGLGAPPRSRGRRQQGIQEAAAQMGMHLQRLDAWSNTADPSALHRASARGFSYFGKMKAVIPTRRTRLQHFNRTVEKDDTGIYEIDITIVSTGFHCLALCRMRGPSVRRVWKRHSFQCQSHRLQHDRRQCNRFRAERLRVRSQHADGGHPENGDRHLPEDGI